MTNDQILALVLAMLAGLIPNVILKYLDKHKSKEEVADIEVDTLSEALKTMREHNDFLEKKLAMKRDEITTQNKLMYEINSQNALLIQQNNELTSKVIELTDKLQKCIDCLEQKEMK